MPFWPFTRPQPQPQTAEELRARLIEAVGTKQLLKLCRAHAEMARDHVGTLIQVPEELRAELSTNPQEMQAYTQRMVAVAQCLADCGVPEVWEAIVGTPESNPILHWDEWLGAIPQRMAALEYEDLVAEAREMIAEARQLEGSAARQYEGYLRGRLGEALFHSGDVDAAAIAYQEALDYCRQQNDDDGVAAYLGNMKEVARYRGDAAAAIDWAGQLADHYAAHGMTTEAEALQAEITRLRKGDPPVRAVCRLADRSYEIEDLPEFETGVSYKFEFVRNRPGMQKCIELTRRGAALAADGQLADALEQLEEASQVDPHDPDPVYQSGVVLMDLGAFDQARDRFDEVHQIAPGWFHCQFDRWLADQLHDGTWTSDVWTLLRGLQDSGLEPPQVTSIAGQLVERFDDFAPFWQLLGEAQQNTEDTVGATASFRRGLECPLEPDIESRLLLGLATQLAPESAERRTLLEQIVSGNGNLFARSVARVMLSRLTPTAAAERQ